MTVIIISGGIDLSVGTALSLAATVLAWALKKDFGAGPAIAACLATGCLCGFVNGLAEPACCARVGAVHHHAGNDDGLASAWETCWPTKTTVRPSASQVPAWMPSLVTPLPKPLWLWESVIPNFGWGVWLTLGLAAVLAALLHLTVFGRHVFALGSNERAAQLCGINIARTRIMVYALAGLFTGM